MRSTTLQDFIDCAGAATGRLKAFRILASDFETAAACRSGFVTC
jgi:hypothetical protein